MTASVPRLGAAAALTVLLLCAGVVPAVANNGGLVTVIDNSQTGTDNSETDSTLEVDRAANTNTGSGTAGSDHDGSAVDVVQAIFGVDGQGGED